MKDNSYEWAMRQIVIQAESAQERKWRAERRAMFWGRVRNAALLASALALAVAVIYYR